MGSAIVRYVSPHKNKKYELMVTTHQMCVLLLFNDVETGAVAGQLSFQEIMRRTNMYVRVRA